MLNENKISMIKRKICIQYLYGIIIVLSLFTFYYFHADNARFLVLRQQIGND